MNPKLAIGLGAIVVRTSGSRHWREYSPFSGVSARAIKRAPPRLATFAVMNPVQKALWFVESHLREAIALEEVANHSGVSPIT